MDKQTVQQLDTEFKRISQKGYIKGIYNCSSSIGRTFENELNLPRNEFSVPDYYGIEIKTKRTYSKSRINLFTAVPDGKDLFEIERLKETYGYPYKKDPKYKALYVDVYENKLTFGGRIYQYQLEVNRNEQKVYLLIYDNNENLIEKKVYWSFEYLEQKISNKLQKLAIINAWTKNIDGWNYFKYYKISFYIYRGFDIFLQLLEAGIIRISFKIDIHLDAHRYGNTYDHGCSFGILEKDITKLYKEYHHNI